jgi:hypothetical protein
VREIEGISLENRGLLYKETGSLYADTAKLSVEIAKIEGFVIIFLVEIHNAKNSCSVNS